MDLRAQHLEELPEFFVQHPLLKHLRISNFAFNGRPVKPVKSGEKVVCHNDDVLLSKIAELKIRSLTMLNCNLGDSEVTEIATNESLTEVDFSSNRITNKGAETIITTMKKLAKLPNLNNNDEVDVQYVNTLFNQVQESRKLAENKILESESINPKQENAKVNIKEEQPAKKLNVPVVAKKEELPPKLKYVTNPYDKAIRVRNINTNTVCKDIVMNIENCILRKKPYKHKYKLFCGKNFKTMNSKIVVVPTKMLSQLESIKTARLQELNPKAKPDEHRWESTLNDVINKGMEASKKSKNRTDKKRKHFYSLFLPENKHEFCKEFKLKKEDLAILEEKGIVTAFNFKS